MSSYSHEGAIGFSTFSPVSNHVTTAAVATGREVGGCAGIPSSLKWWQGEAPQTHHETSGFWLVGGLEHFLFSHIFGIIIPFDFHIFQRGWNHQPVGICWSYPFFELPNCGSCGMTWASHGFPSHEAIWWWSICFLAWRPIGIGRPCPNLPVDLNRGE